MSDVYAMGGQVCLALNICCLSECLPPEIIIEILRGGADKVAEAGGAVAGGHSIDDKEPKYGLVVLGFVHPDRVLTKGGAKPGDVLVGTKPLGVGIITTAYKGDQSGQGRTSRRSRGVHVPVEPRCRRVATGGPPARMHRRERLWSAQPCV